MDYALLNAHKNAFRDSYQSAKKALSAGKLSKAKQYISMAKDSCEYIIRHTVDAEEKEKYKGLRNKLKELEHIIDNPPQATPSKTGESNEEKEKGKPSIPIVVPKLVPLEKSLTELDSYIGLGNVKEQVHSLVEQLQVFQLRKSRNLKVPDMTYHMVFTGNPGTGKTTVARLLAQIFRSLGLLSKGQLVEVKRDALVAEYVGQTAIKTQQVIDSAIGGVLFIDEAYSLAKGGNDYGQEAIDTLLVAMENNRDDLIVIVAGYDELMDKFLKSNPGLPSRFMRKIHFDDYNPDELLAIYEKFCKDNQYRLSPTAKDKLSTYFAEMYANREEHFGNGREVRKFFEETVKKQSPRINATKATKKHLSDEEIMTILPEDLPN